MDISNGILTFIAIATSRGAQTLDLGVDFLPKTTDGGSSRHQTVTGPAGQKRIRFRDIWDLAWLKQNHATLIAEWLQARVSEFDIKDYGDRIQVMKSALPGYLYDGDFTAEMRRFLPQDVSARTLDRDDFMSYLDRTVTALLDQAQSAYSGSSEAARFKM